MLNETLNTMYNAKPGSGSRSTQKCQLLKKLKVAANGSSNQAECIMSQAAVTAAPAVPVPKPQGKQGSLFIYAPDPQRSWVQIPCDEIEFHHQRHTR
jgi:hypothetical protein